METLRKNFEWVVGRLAECFLKSMLPHEELSGGAIREQRTTAPFRHDLQHSDSVLRDSGAQGVGSHGKPYEQQ
jgi:hypothetical protein